MNIIRNLSVLILFFGIIIMTIYITKSYTYKIEDSLVKQAKLDNKKREMDMLLKKHNSKRPSKIFGNMFTEPTVWMGYSDQDTIDKNISTYDQAFDRNKSQKYSAFEK